MLKQGGFKFWNARENEILGLQKTAARSECDCGDIEKTTFKKQRVFQHNRLRIQLVDATHQLIREKVDEFFNRDAPSRF